MAMYKTWSLNKLHILKRSEFYLFIAIIILIIRVLHLDGPDIIMDDAYISFRYAENFAKGLGLVYNTFEQVEGYTNFLWTILLGMFASLKMDLTFVSKLLSGLSAIGSIIMLYLFSKQLFMQRRNGWFLSAMVMVLFAAMGSQARYVVSGMETLFFTFLLCLSIYIFLYSPNKFLAGIVFGLTAMARPEGVMYFLISLGYSVFISSKLIEDQQFTRSEIIKFIIGFAITYGPYFIWRVGYYGYPFPNTYYAKASDITLFRVMRGWNYFREIVGKWSLLFPLFLSLFSLKSWKSDRFWFFAACIFGATTAYFILVGGDFIVWFGPRFLIPALPFLLLMTMEGARIITELKFFPEICSQPILILLSGFLLINGLWFSWPSKLYKLDNFSAQMRSWKELGVWMEKNLPEGTTIATDAAGLIPYYSEFYTIDMFGLTDEHIAHLDISDSGTGIVAHEKIDPEYILERYPDCIVSTWMDEKGQAISAGLASVQDEFKDNYHLIALAKVRNGPPQDDRWVIVTSKYSKNLYKNGYQSGLFCR